MRFSPFGNIPSPNVDLITREYNQQELKTDYIPNLQRKLSPGWLKTPLFHLDSMLHGRWEYWLKLQLVPAEKYELLTEPDPNKRLENIQRSRKTGKRKLKRLSLFNQPKLLHQKLLGQTQAILNLRRRTKRNPKVSNDLRIKKNRNLCFKLSKLSCFSCFG